MTTGRRREEGAVQEWVRSHPDPLQVGGARFIYRAATGTSYLVFGSGEPGEILQGCAMDYWLVAHRTTDGARVGSMRFGLEPCWLLAAPDHPLGGQKALQWWRALRRLAVEQAKGELDADRLAGDLEPRVLGASDAEALTGFQYRECLFQEEDARGGLHCTAAGATDDMTTRNTCAECAVPDPWEICRHVTGVSTKGVYTDQEGFRGRVLLPGVCQLGKIPGNGIPASCRGGGPGRPACFEPREIVSQLLHAKAEEEEAEDLVSAVNVAWEDTHGFKLFDLVSFAPLAVLRGPCTGAPDFHNRALQLGELIAKLNESEMRGKMDLSVAERIQGGHTVCLLEAFLGQMGSPQRSSIVANLRRVQRLRNLPPTHPPDAGGERAIEELRGMGFAYPVPREECPRAWEVVRGIFCRALECLREDLGKQG